MIDAKEEHVKILAKQLKLPAFTEYMDIIRQCKPDAEFSDVLIELLNAEITSRRENQNRRRQKAAGFPYLKTLDPRRGSCAEREQSRGLGKEKCLTGKNARRLIRKCTAP